MATSDGDRIFTRHGRVGPVRHDVAPVLAARPSTGTKASRGCQEALRVDQECWMSASISVYTRSFGGGTIRGSSTAHAPRA